MLEASYETLPDFWSQCENCHRVTWVEAYTGLCEGCTLERAICLGED